MSRYADKGTKARRERERDPGGRRSRPSGIRSSWIALPPILALVLLQLPILGLGYYWDDFYFLTFRGQGGLLLPDPHFFRPIPLGLYFQLLRVADPVRGTVAHLLNLALLAGAVLILVNLVSRLAGPRAGLFAGFVFAGYAHVSALAAWISTSTDLLAILFVAAAFFLRHRGNDLGALACATAGLLSKESAITAFPVLILWDWLVGRPKKRPWIRLAGYTAIAAAWALVHPGIHGLLEHGLQRGSAAYVGVGHSDLWGTHLLRYLMTLLNLPPPGLHTEWLEDRVVYAIVAWCIALAGWLVLDRRLPAGPCASIRRIALLSASFWVPAVLMPTILVRHWAPYLACLPALGISILLGTLLARQPRFVALGILAIFLILGARSRGLRGEREPILSEPLMVEASEAARTVRANFRTVFPSFPEGSQVAASVATSGLRGIQGALFEGQALSLWYRDPTLRTVRIMNRAPDASPEYLVRVTDDLDVIAIDPLSGNVRTSASRAPGLAEIDPPLGAYARAVAAESDTDRAVGIMTSLSRIESRESGDLVARNDRIIASMLLAAGREREADSILAVTRSFPREVSRDAVLRILANPSPSETLDMAAFEAFGLSASDPETLRWMARQLWNVGARAQASWLAGKLGQLVPGDPEAGSILEDAAERGIQPSRRIFLKPEEGTGD